jgi:hypothetical protein
LASEDVPVQLTTLWAAVEAIIPSPLDDARIQTITDTLGPVLSLGYAEKLFADLDQSLLRCMADEYARVVTDAGFDKPGARACAFITAIGPNEPFRDRLYAACDRNPLLRYRIFRLKRMFETAGATSATIAAHTQRILWHLRRLYRTRNMIVHAGRTVPFRETLVENLHAYLHQTINALLGLYLNTSFPSTLDAAFLALRLQHERHVWHLKTLGDTPCDVLNADAVLFGEALPN